MRHLVQSGEGGSLLAERNGHPLIFSRSSIGRAGSEELGEDCQECKNVGSLVRALEKTEKILGVRNVLIH